MALGSTNLLYQHRQVLFHVESPAVSKTFIHHTPEYSTRRVIDRPAMDPAKHDYSPSRFLKYHRYTVGLATGQPDSQSLKSWKTYHNYMKKVSLEFVSVLSTGLGLFLLSTIQVSAQPLVKNTPTGSLTDGANISINPEEPLPANGTVSVSTEGVTDTDMNIIPPEGVTVIISNDTATVTNQEVDIATAEGEDEGGDAEDEGGDAGDEGDEGDPGGGDGEEDEGGEPGEGSQLPLPGFGSGEGSGSNIGSNGASNGGGGGFR